MCWANREHPVAALPVKVALLGTQRFHELRRFTFYLFDKLEWCMHFTHVEQNVNVIDDSADNDIGRVHAPNNCCQISVYARSDFCVEKRFPILRAKNQMRVQLC